MKEIYEMHGRVHLIGSCGPASPGGKICRAVPSLVLGQAANWRSPFRGCNFLPTLHPTPTCPPAGWSNG